MATSLDEPIPVEATESSPLPPVESPPAVAVESVPVPPTKPMCFVSQGVIAHVPPLVSFFYSFYLLLLLLWPVSSLLFFSGFQFLGAPVL